MLGCAQRSVTGGRGVIGRGARATAGAIVLLGPSSPAMFAQCPGSYVAVPGLSAIEAGQTVQTILHVPAPGGGNDAIIGGWFACSGGAACANLARYSPATGLWAPLGSGVNDWVTSVVELPGGDLIVGGRFTVAGGVPANRIARYSPATGAWTALGATAASPGGGVDGQVLEMLVLPPGSGGAGGNAGDVLVAGAFTTAGGAPADSLARYSPTTDSWSKLAGTDASGNVPFGTSTFSARGSMLLLPGPGGSAQVLIDGSTSLGSGARLIRYDPAAGTWSAPSPSLSSDIYAMAPLPDGNILVGGLFTRIDSVAAPNRLAVYAVSTNTFSPVLGSSTSTGGTVFGLRPLPDGRVLITGSFTSMDGQAAGRIATYSPATGSLASDFGIGFDNSIRATALAPDGRSVLIGGRFMTAGGMSSPLLARYRFESTCPADFDCNGTRDVADIFALLSAWFASDPRADFSQNGTRGVDDIFSFLSAWFAGC